MRIYDVIKNKRDGRELSTDEINFVVRGYTQNAVPDYQVSALLMAIYFRGLSERETLDLTLAIADSGDKMDLSKIKGFKVDKHSSGGVGDKTTLVVAPLVAACGVKVAKMSGKGLGHTGGTIDKLEAIPGFVTALSPQRFAEIVNTVGVAVVGQSGALAPADKKLYALRDVTATVDSLPLIASSIMGKKLASADDGIVLDVKFGSGGFCKTVEDGRALAQAMVKIGIGAGKQTVAVLSDMNRPLGRNVGNALEVVEAIQTLKNHGEPRFVKLCLSLAQNMLKISGFGTDEQCLSALTDALQSGAALRKFREMVAAQGGDVRYVDDETLFDLGSTFSLKSPKSGFISQIDTEKCGLASLALGAGRNTKEDAIDAAAGIEVLKNLGECVECGEVIAILHSSDRNMFEAAAKIYLSSLTFGEAKPTDSEIVVDVIS